MVWQYIRLIGQLKADILHLGKPMLNGYNLALVYGPLILIGDLPELIDKLRGAEICKYCHRKQQNRGVHEEIPSQGARQQFYPSLQYVMSLILILHYTHFIGESQIDNFSMAGERR